jgi:hypothetical protein
VKFELEVARRALRLAQREDWISGLPEFARTEHLRMRLGFFDGHEWAQIRETLAARFSRCRRPRFLSGWHQMKVLDLRWTNDNVRAGLVCLEVGSTKRRWPRDSVR